MVAEKETANAGPLAGLRVVELSHILAAPTCGLMLADLGADVVKIERPPKGDMTRWDTIEEDRMGAETASFMTVNRNKRSLALDLKSEAGKAVLGRLLARADVLVENYRPGVLDRLGFGYDELKARCPRLVYCSITGYGRSGPLAERGGFDLVAQAMSGLMSVTGEGPDRPPVKCGSPMTDIGAGILAAMGILAAVHERERSGRGQLVDTSLLEAGIAFTYWQSALVFASGMTPRAMGSAHPLYAPYQAFETADGWIALGTSNEANWRRLLDALDLPALGEDPRFRDADARMKNRAALEALLAERFRTRSTEAWLAALEPVGIPLGPVLTVNEMHDHPQVRAREMVTEVEHSRLGPVPALGCPVKFSTQPSIRKRGAPLLGEHSREVLRECGYGEAEIEALLRDGVQETRVPSGADREPA
jgi:crotonobetainyl-CoA:carnitine CoA-transferase CaiB-like acyl-CoA transferase